MPLGFFPRLAGLVRKTCIIESESKVDGTVGTPSEFFLLCTRTMPDFFYKMLVRKRKNSEGVPTVPLTLLSDSIIQVYRTKPASLGKNPRGAFSLNIRFWQY